MQDIYISVEYSNLKDIIPPGEEIIYSTLCLGYYLEPGVQKLTTHRWKTHVLFTLNGVAYFGIKIGLLKNQLEPKFTYWDDVFTQEVRQLGKAVGFTTHRRYFALVNDVNYETNEEFIKRSKEFIPKMRNHMINSYEKWLEKNRNNPDIKKSKKKYAENRLKRLKKKSIEK